MDQIQRYVYTRLLKEQSPHNKHGFQSAFIPETWNDRGVILELESRIHFPGYDDFTTKDFVFYRELGGQAHLVLMNLRLLPDARDEQGRGGIFLVQGFIVPPEVHREIREPLRLLNAMDSLLFKDRESILASDQVDMEKGMIKNVEWTLELIQKVSDIDPLPLVEWEKKLLSFLVKQTQGEMDDWVLVVKGEPRKVSEMLNRLTGFMPTVIREQIGWDPAFDGGKIFFTAFKTFGYLKQEPVTGNPLIFDLGQKVFYDSSLEHQLLRRDHPFDRFILDGLLPSTEQKDIDAIFELASSLWKGNGVPAGNSLQKPYADSIEDLVRGYFGRAVGDHLPGSWVANLQQRLPYGEVCRLMNGRLAPGMLAETLGAHILRNDIEPGNTPDPLPGEMVDKSGPLLQLLNSMWTKKEVADAQVRSINQTELAQSFRLMSRTQLVKEDWFFQRLAGFPQAFSNLIQQAKVRTHAEKWLTNRIPRSFGKMKSTLVNFMMDRGLLEGLEAENPDWNRYLEVYAQEQNFDQKQLKSVVKIVKKQGMVPTAAPFLKAIVFPGDSIPASVGMNQEYRGRLARALVICHGYNSSKLQAYGFSKAEAKVAMGNRSGLVGWFKNLFGM